MGEGTFAVVTPEPPAGAMKATDAVRGGAIVPALLKADVLVAPLFESYVSPSHGMGRMTEGNGLSSAMASAAGSPSDQSLSY